MEGDRQDATVSKVLDDDNLLIEILLRVGFPTTLVCAGLVCKRWLWHVSDKAFLGRFRKLHPPRLLGFYINTGMRPCFMPMLPQPPELAAIVDCAGFCLDTWQCAPTDIMDCRNGRVFTRLHKGPGFKLGVHSPLCAERGTTTVPPFPRYRPLEGRLCIWPYFLSKEQGGDLSYFYVLIESSQESPKVTVQVYMLQDGVWCAHHTLATDQPPSLLLWESKPVMVNNKIYMAAAQRNIIVLDLTVSSFSTICLPQGVEYANRDTALSRADDASGVYLIQVGDYVEFVFFKMGRCILYLNIKSRTLRKVYELSEEDQYWGDISIHPFMMIWPPTFPALKGDPTRIAM